LDEAGHKLFDGVWDGRGEGEKVGNGGYSTQGRGEGEEKFGGAMDVVRVEEEGVVVGSHTCKGDVERIGGTPVVRSDHGVMVAEFDGHGMGGEISETLEIGMVKKIKNRKGIESSGESLGKEMEVSVWKALIEGFIKEQSVPGGVKKHDDARGLDN
jgi:hypothetical protein